MTAASKLVAPLSDGFAVVNALFQHGRDDATVGTVDSLGYAAVQQLDL